MSYVQQLYEERKARLARLNDNGETLARLKARAENDRAEKLERRVHILETALQDLQKRFNTLRVDRRGDAQDDLVVIGDQRPTIKFIKEVVRKYFELHAHELDSARRTRQVAYPRQIVMYLARIHTLHSFPQIARMLGKRDHTTVLFGHHKIERLVKSDWTVAYDIAMIERRL